MYQVLAALCLTGSDHVAQATHDQGLQWLKAAVDLVPEEAASASDRGQLLSAASAIVQNNAANGSRCCCAPACI